MAIVKNNKLVKIRKKSPRNKQDNKSVKKYNCHRCKDSGIVLNKDSKQIKCGCKVTIELLNWLDNRLKTVVRRASTAIFTIETITKNDEPHQNVLYKGVKTNLYLEQVIKHIAKQYFLRGMATYNYKLMTGNDYTEKYVIGEHIDYHKAEELFIMLGQDNYNQTLKTTIYSLVNERALAGKLTWILIPDLKISTGSLMDLYGDAMVSYLKDSENFDKVYIHNGG